MSIPELVIMYSILIPLVLMWFIREKNAIELVFPNEYASLKCNLPKPLKRCGPLGGSIGYSNLKEGISFYLDIYSDKVIVSSMGRALCLDYSSYSFSRCRVSFYHAVKIGPIRVLKTDATAIWKPIVTISPYDANPNDPKDTLLTILLPRKDLDFLLDLVQQAQQNKNDTPAQP